MNRRTTTRYRLVRRLLGARLSSRWCQAREEVQKVLGRGLGNNSISHFWFSIEPVEKEDAKRCQTMRSFSMMMTIGKGYRLGEFRWSLVMIGVLVSKGQWCQISSCGWDEASIGFSRRGWSLAQHQLHNSDSFCVLLLGARKWAGLSPGLASFHEHVSWSF